MKVHFAGEKKGEEWLFKQAGVKYRLNSFYYILKNQWAGFDEMNYYNHVIIDSGLFTFMFGADSKNDLTIDFLEDWYKKYTTFINQSTFKNASFVEMDVQKKVSVEYAWELRHRIRKDCPEKRFITPYHLEDGNPDKLIAFTDYIAVSMPELRFNITAKERRKITEYICNKAKSKGKAVHLLGCTEDKYIRDFSWVDTADSTSYTFIRRSNTFKMTSFEGFGIKDVDLQKLKASLPRLQEEFISIFYNLVKYEGFAGSQD